MIDKFKKTLKNIGVSLAVGMAKADSQILNGNVEKAPEVQDKVSQNFSQVDFLRAVQLGKFTEQQLLRFNRTLDAIDDYHGRTELVMIEPGYWKDVLDDDDNLQFNDEGETIQEWVEPVFETVMIDKEEKEDRRQKLGDVLEGYYTKHFLTNKKILINMMSAPGKEEEQWTMDVMHNVYAPFKIENYCTEIYIKYKTGQDIAVDKTALVELYCLPYNIRNTQWDNNGNVKSDMNEILLVHNLHTFCDIESFTCAEQTATRNNIVHKLHVNKFIEAKTYNKGFVVKFECQHDAPEQHAA